jgi:putative transcriptional regulator
MLPPQRATTPVGPLMRAKPMSLQSRRQLIIAFAGLLLPGTLAGAVPGDPTGTPDQGPAHVSLAGQLLVASSVIGGGPFHETVVLMVEHDRKGALGLVINRPVAEQPLAALLDALGQDAAGAAGDVRIFWGGPVQPDRVFVLHDGDYRRPGSIDIGGRMAISAGRDVFRDLAAGTGPAKRLIAFGYAGWAPGQLEGELAAKAWFTAPADPKLVFDEDRDRLWEIAMERRTREL